MFPSGSRPPCGGHLDCEGGVMWATGRRCDVCAEVVAEKFAARQRTRLPGQVLYSCPLVELIPS
ncbi:hypothetical protein [Streptomyces sp. SLBN-118]|uniref:hypothetical protein n=1 Tax=Streptomyces sp. SLBN-118 TaxID=2768454 RepID=UPI00114E5F4F|nr:hypothetical protein [Streptomyces sp. SLBN-118]